MTFNLAILQASKICDDQATALEKSGTSTDAQAAAELRQAAIAIRRLKRSPENPELRPTL